MKLEQKPVAMLIPYVNNARTHNENQVKQIASSIKEFGFNNPVLIDDDNSIIAGHGRVQAAELLGLYEIPTITLPHLSETQKKAYILADNRMALNAGWDIELLKLEILDLNDKDFDLALTGFDDDELAEFLKEEIEPQSDEDAVPEIPDEPVSKEGDIWILGNHRVMCGDSTSIDAVEKLMDGQKSNICFTSPPYNAKTAEVLSSNGKKSNKYLKHDDSQSDDDYMSLLVEFTDCAIQYADYIFVNIQMLSGNKSVFIEYLYQYKQNLVDVAIWTKTNPQPAMAKNVMNSAYEYIVILSPETNPSRAINSGNFRGTFSNVYSSPVNSRNNYSDIHSATFSVEFAQHYIENASTRNAIVSDYFGGTGTTLIACEKTNRNARLMELDPKYVDVIVKRWQDYTGKDAILESTNETFNSLLPKEDAA